MKKIKKEIKTSSQIESIDFKKEIENAITAEELKKRTTTFIKTLKWEK